MEEQMYPSRSTKIIVFLVMVTVVLAITNTDVMQRISHLTFRSFEAILKEMDKFCVNYQINRGAWRDAATTRSGDESPASN
jgi:hypothetical protein